VREEFGKHLLELSKEDSRVYVLDCDLANSTKTNYVAEQNRSKFIQCGIAEQNAMSMAGGMASTGLQPWIVSFGAFIVERCLDQIKVSVAQPKLDVKIIGCYTGILNGKVGKTHQAINDIAIMRTIPGMVILCPADSEELKQMMSWANEYNGPVYIRLTRESNPVYSSFYQWIPFKAHKSYFGKDITIISTGTHSYYAEKAVNNLNQEGIECALIDMPMIKPIDKNSIIEAAKETGAIVTVEDHSIIGGLGSAVTEIVSEHYPVPVLRIGIQDKNIEAGTNEELLDKYELSTEYIIKKVKVCLALKKG
jgi:transketolase